MEQEDHIATFCAITAATPTVAEHYLDACNWDVERAVEFFLENPPADAQARPASAAPQRAPSPPRAPPRAATATEAVNIDDDDFPLDEDEELQRALAASLGQPHEGAAPIRRPAAGAGAPRAGPPPPRPGYQHPGPTCVEVPDSDDEGPGNAEEEELQFLARATASRRAAQAEAQRHMEEMVGFAARMARGMPPFIGDPEQLGVSGTGIGPSTRRGGPLGQRPSHVRFPSDDGAGPSGRAQPYEEGVRFPSDDDDFPMHMAQQEDHGFQLPDDVNLEEARMLEAAMLGRPYQGRIPDFANQPPPRALSPGAASRQMLRQEQDDAYEASLRRDREKAEATEREQRAAAEAARREAEAREAEARAAADAAAKLAAALAQKRSRVPAEPPAGADGALTVMVRLPGGGRMSRRFRRGDAAQAVFDWLDTAAEEGAAPAPGGYNLVAQFPRKVWSEGVKGTLEEAGATGDTAFFLEALK